MLTANVIVKSVGPLHFVSEHFKVRELVGITDEIGERQFLKFRFINDNCALLDDVFAGDRAEVMFNITGREWINPGTGESNIFNTLDAERISRYEQRANQ